MFKVNHRQDKLIRQRKSSAFSKGELIIANYLKDNQINFYPEFYFKEMTVNKVLKLLFFDFYVPDYFLCIEFDGEQHYTRKFNGKRMVNGAANDFLKNAFCKKKGLHLLRIKYTDIDNIESIIYKKFDQIT